MKNLSLVDWRNRMEELVKEQRSELELLRATVKELRARLEKLEPPLHPPRQHSTISEIRNTAVQLASSPSRPPKCTPKSEIEEPADPLPANSQSQQDVFSKLRTSQLDEWTRHFVVIKDNDTSPEELTGSENILLSDAGRTEMEVLQADTTLALHIPTAAGSSNSKPEMNLKSLFDHRRSSTNSASTLGTDEHPLHQNTSVCLNTDSQTKGCSGAKRFKCEMCPRDWSKMSELKRHMRVHTGEKPFSCETCQRSFSRGNNLKRHMIIHTGEKPFICEVCRKTFSLNRDLTTHMRIHTGEKPFSCNVCNAVFRRSSDLANHARVHTGERPYVCKVCGADYKKWNHLARHKKKHRMPDKTATACSTIRRISIK